MTRQRPDMSGLVLVLLAVVGWGANWPALKLLLLEMPPLTGRGYAGMLSAGALALVASLRGISMVVPRREWPRLVLMSLLNITAWNGLTIFGLFWLTASEGTIIAYTMPVYAALLAWPVLGEKPRAGQMMALALGLSGMVVLIGGRGLDIGLEKLPGVAFIIAGALLFALGAVMTKRAPLPLPPLASVSWQIAIGSLPLLLLSFVLEQPHFAALSGRAWTLFAYMAAVPLCLSYVAWFAGLQRLPASVATICTLVAPVVGVLLAAMTLGEPLGWREVYALGATLAAVILAVRR